MQFCLRTVMATIAVTVLGGAAQAFPPFKAKEEVPSCTYCHLKPGGGARNYRGIFYKQHGNTFAGFDDAAEAKKAGVEVGPFPEAKPKSQTPPEDAKPVETPKEEEKPMGPSKEVVAAQANVKTTEAAYKKNMKSAPAKLKYADALAQLGHATMLDTTMLPKDRYPAALKLANQSLKIDPKNKTALADKKSIEDAYKSMGRPIPK